MRGARVNPGCAAHATIIPESRLCEGSWAQAPAHGVVYRGYKLKKMPIRPLVCLVSACVFPAVLRAEPPDLVQFRVGAGVEHNTNVLRAPTGEQSDDIGVLSVGAKIDRTYSLQRVRADVEASSYRYRNLSRLNYSTLNYLAAWDWKFTPALHGVLSAERRQFRDISDTVAGIQEIGRRTERAERFEGIYDIDGAWRALAGVSRTSSSTTVPVSWDASPTVRSARVGGGYEYASGSSVFVRARRGDGEYKALLTPGAPADFRENEGDVQLKWILTGKTSLPAWAVWIGRMRELHSAISTGRWAMRRSYGTPRARPAWWPACSTISAVPALPPAAMWKAIASSSGRSGEPRRIPR